MRKFDNEEEFWRRLLTGENPSVPMRHARRVFGWFSAHQRCKVCNIPFDGRSSVPLRLIWGGQSKLSPHFCSKCETFAGQHIGGAEIEMTMFFADVRNSTTIAEGMSPGDFARLMNRFYKISTDALVASGGWIDKFVGDAVVGLFVPGFAGSDHASRAIVAAQKIIKAVADNGQNVASLPVGIGIHTGPAFMGAVGTEGITDITALGDNVNITARLASVADAGEIIISDDACKAARIDASRLDHRKLTLRGKREAIDVRVMRPQP